MIINPFIVASKVEFSSLTVTRWSFDQFNVVGSTDRWANVYAYILASGSTPPTSHQVKVNGESALATAYFNIELDSLSAATNYDVYVVAEDVNGILQDSPTRLDVTSAPNLNTKFGSNLKLWLNGRSGVNKSLSGIWSEIVSNTTSSETSGLLFSNATSAGATTKYNGKGFVFGSAGLQGPTNKTRLKFCHTGAAFTIVSRIQVFENDTTNAQPIINTSAGSTGKTGFFIAYDNRSALSRTHALVFTVTKSSSGVSIFNVVINNFFALRQYTTVTIKYDGVSTLTIYKDGVSQSTYSPTNTPFSSGDSSDDIGIGKLSSGATYASCLSVVDIVVTDTAMNDSDRGFTESFMTSYAGTLGSCGKANMYIMNGQSNQAGSPHISTLPSYLTGPMKTFVWSLTDNTTNISSAQYPVPLQAGVSQNTESLSAFGPEMEFGYRMSEFIPNVTFLAKYAKSATPLYYTAGNDDWNIASATTRCAYQAAAQIYGMYRYAKFILDRDVVVRGWIWHQGEADAQTGNANYKTDLYNLFNSYYTRYSSVGYTPSKGRGLISLIDQTFNPARTYQSNINAALSAFATDYFTDNPTKVGQWLSHATKSKAGFPLSDGTHLTSNGMISEGLDYFNYFKPYVDE